MEQESAEFLTQTYQVHLMSRPTKALREVVIIDYPRFKVGRVYQAIKLKEV